MLSTIQIHKDQHKRCIFLTRYKRSLYFPDGWLIDGSICEMSTICLDKTLDGGGLRHPGLSGKSKVTTAQSTPPKPLGRVALTRRNILCDSNINLTVPLSAHERRMCVAFSSGLKYNDFCEYERDEMSYQPKRQGAVPSAKPPHRK